VKPKALVAMSGGVDSSVAAALMLEKGYECTGLTFRLFKGGSSDLSDAKAVAAGLGIPHRVLDLSGDFDALVIRRFAGAYGQGLTPNPCVDCNRYIKFTLGLLSGLDFDCLVTGHYARVEKDSLSGRFLLRKSLDNRKDQSYVLYSLSQEQLGRSIFPLGELSKTEVRKIAGEKNFINAAKGESQDICFVPGGDYGDFIETYAGKTWPPGDIIDAEGKALGRHRGIIRYTIGQRRGLGIAANTPVYVTAKSIQDNTVTLGPESALYGKGLNAKDINLIACGRLEKPVRVKVKTRYLQDEQPALAEQTGEDSLHIEFDRPQRAVTPGQAAVMYDGDIVVGGGTIIVNQ
jgi:tRNA-specific 2-thiouridylase